MEAIDLVIVGAGWSGLCAAKTYCELNPLSKIVILESANLVGGVWATEHLYPQLRSNNMIGTYEYPDFPIDESYGVKPGQHMPGHVMQQYLDQYADINGIHKCIRFGSKVSTAERTIDDTWLLKITVSEADKGSRQSQIVAKRLIIATGVFSEPFIPSIEKQSSFEGTILHSKDFAQHAGTLKSAESVVIYGGTKSAWDAAYAYAKADVQVHMVIRESCHGPVYMAPPYVTPLKRWLEKLATTRLLTWFSPCIWGDADGYGRIRQFFHGTWVGRKVVDAFWRILANDIVTLNGYDKHPETAKLKPWFSAFWIGASLGILNYDTSFFELVRKGQIKVYIADIESLSSKTVNLSDGTSIPTSVLLHATGWKSRSSITFLPSGIEASLGIPHQSCEPNKVASKADAEILARFPRLKDQPARNPKSRNLDGTADSLLPVPDEPYRLYRFMVPPTDILSQESRTIAFCGALSTTITPICAQVQALWIAAYFSEQLKLDYVDNDPGWSATLHSQYGKWRYPVGHGARFPDFVFDGIPYIDMLLRDLGLETHRKGGGMREIFEPYGVEDYRGLIDEWKGEGRSNERSRVESRPKMA